MRTALLELLYWLLSDPKFLELVSMRLQNMTVDIIQNEDVRLALFELLRSEHFSKSSSDALWGVLGHTFTPKYFSRTEQEVKDGSPQSNHTQKDEKEEEAVPESTEEKQETPMEKLLRLRQEQEKIKLQANSL